MVRGTGVPGLVRLRRIALPCLSVNEMTNAETTVDDSVELLVLPRAICAVILANQAAD